MNNHRPYTAKYQGVTNCIKSDVHVTAGIKIPKNKFIIPNSPKYTAIWDTGATGSAITDNFVLDLGLKPTGVQLVSTANGVMKSNIFLINIYLPNRTVFTTRATVCNLGTSADLFIGMEVITRGDFTITNRKGNITFSFQVPSIEEIDLAQGTSRRLIPIDLKISGRNDPCPCGSGRKYNLCHGQFN